MFSTFNPKCFKYDISYLKEYKHTKTLLYFRQSLYDCRVRVTFSEGIMYKELNKEMAIFWNGVSRFMP